MTICPVLTDLQTQAGTLRTVLRAIRHDLSLCEKCEIKCAGHAQYRQSLSIAITQTLTDIQQLGIPSPQGISSPKGVTCPKPSTRK